MRRIGPGWVEWLWAGGKLGRGWGVGRGGAHEIGGGFHGLSGCFKKIGTIRLNTGIPLRLKLSGDKIGII